MHIAAWTTFIILIGFLMALDLGVFHRKAHTIGGKEALAWSLLWISIGLGFSGIVYFAYEYQWDGLGLGHFEAHSGREAMLTYLTAYLIEKSLSLDNIFVMALVFNYFQIPGKYRHEVLFWGIIGALVFRGLMIGGGLFLIHRFEWLIYVFGFILLYSVYKMIRLKDTEIDPRKNPIVNFFKPSSPSPPTPSSFTPPTYSPYSACAPYSLSSTPCSTASSISNTASLESSSSSP